MHDHNHCDVSVINLLLAPVISIVDLCCLLWSNLECKLFCGIPFVCLMMIYASVYDHIELEL